jgi:rhodanese-related sulfurtransferase
MKHASGFIGLVEEAMPRIKEVNAYETRAMQEKLDPFLLIDVREDREWMAGHIQGAAHIGRGVLERDIEQTIPDKAAKIVLYCGGGYRSALAADNLQRMGYTNVYSMAGGWRAWLEAGFPRE